MRSQLGADRVSDMTVGADGKSGPKESRPRGRDGLESIRFRGTTWLVVSLVLDAGALIAWLIFDNTPAVVVFLVLSGFANGQSWYRRGLVDAGRMIEGSIVERRNDSGKWGRI